MLVTIALIYQAHRIKKKIKISTKYTNKYLNLVILILVNLKKNRRNRSKLYPRKNE